MRRVVGIATVKGREESLKDTIKSLENQVDFINVYDGNIEGDKVKFTGYAPDVHYFSCDDDLIYPPDYCDKMIECLNKHRKVAFDIPQTHFPYPIITAHGRSFIQPITNYHKNGIKYHCLHEVKEDVKIDCGGTGVMMLTGQLNFSLDDFKEKNMADVWIAKFAKEQNVPIVCMAHKAGWISHSDKFDLRETIYERRKDNNEIETQIIKSIFE